MFYRLVEIDGVNMNVVCDGAGNLGLLVTGGNSYLLRKGEGIFYNYEPLVEGTWSGGTTIMSTFDVEPEMFEWHDHEFEFTGNAWVIDPGLEEWTE